MDIKDFGQFFEDLHGYRPFRWQERLLHTVLDGGWPEIIKLPTGAGKTCLIDIAIFQTALEAELPEADRRAPRRIIFVVDRRLVVDEAHDRACAIRAGLTSPATGLLRQVAERLRLLGGDDEVLLIRRLRGGLPRERAFIENPLQPAVILSTVDQVGSRLLFRGYGVSENMRPIHAALVGMDSLMILDEAHVSQPFVETLGWIRRYQSERWAQRPTGRPLTLVQMTATPPPGVPAFVLTAEDNEDRELAVRLDAPKPTSLLAVPTDKEDRKKACSILAEALAIQAEKMMDELMGEVTAPVIGVVANRVLTARLACQRLLQGEKAEAILLTGRMRPYDRNRLVDQYIARIRATRSPTANPTPLFVVATQTIEVGADLDFDALVTESAALDALRQRFGRLNRLGRRDYCRAAIVHDKQADKVDPVYGPALLATWKWLEKVAVKQRGQRLKQIDFGIRALEARLPQGDDLAELQIPVRPAPVLLPAHLDLLVQTSPAPAIEPDLSALLHGPETQPADVQVLWRADIDEETKNIEHLSLMLLPPRQEEILSLSISAVRAIVRGVENHLLFDIEGGQREQEERGTMRPRRVLRWRGREDSKWIAAQDIQPGDTIVLREGIGSPEDFQIGLSQQCDVGDEVARALYDQALLRMHPALVDQWFLPHADNEMKEEYRNRVRGLCHALDNTPDPDDMCRDLAAQISAYDLVRPDIRETCSRLANNPKAQALPYPPSGPIQGVLLIEPRNTAIEFTDDDDASSLTRQVPLEDHCTAVEAKAASYAEQCGLSEHCNDLRLAGRGHDLGKADPRFQAWLHGGDRIAAKRAPVPLAKSSVPARDSAALIRARFAANYPKGTRHECYSVALVRHHPDLIAGVSDKDLLEYLIGTHHGRGRPFFPVVLGDPGTRIRLRFRGRYWELVGQHGLDRIDSEWADLFWRLVRRYGYWGLAYLETLLRLADHRQSAEDLSNR